MALINARTTNWTIVPGPTAGVGDSSSIRELEPEAALQRLWGEIAHVCRLDEPDPVAAWKRRG